MKSEEIILKASFNQLNFIAGYQIKVWNAGGCVLGCTFQIGGNETSWKYLASGQTTTSEKFYRLDEPVVVSVDALACGETHCYGLSQKIQVRRIRIGLLKNFRPSGLLCYQVKLTNFLQNFYQIKSKSEWLLTILVFIDPKKISRALLPNVKLESFSSTQNIVRHLDITFWPVGFGSEYEASVMGMSEQKKNIWTRTELSSVCLGQNLQISCNGLKNMPRP